jgi:hypothetical protein
MTMNAQLSELCGQFRLNAKRAKAIVTKAGEQRFALRPKPDSWSVAECLAHLTISTEMFLPEWRAAFARLPQGDGPYKMDLVGKVFHWGMQPPPRFRVKAPAKFRPVDTSEALAKFLASQEQLLAVVSESKGLALDRIKVASPADSRVRFNVWSSFRIAEAHQRRHLWQAERALIEYGL